jgi:hypothetical protein
MCLGKRLETDGAGQVHGVNVLHSLMGERLARHSNPEMDESADYERNIKIIQDRNEKARNQ